jgi:hypothetical protein
VQFELGPHHDKISGWSPKDGLLNSLSAFSWSLAIQVLDDPCFWSHMGPGIFR